MKLSTLVSCCISNKPTSTLTLGKAEIECQRNQAYPKELGLNTKRKKKIILPIFGEISATRLHRRQLKPLKIINIIKIESTYGALS